MRARGTTHALPGGTFRVRVYANVDPLTGKRHDLMELAASPGGPKGCALAC